MSTKHWNITQKSNIWRLSFLPFLFCPSRSFSPFVRDSDHLASWGLSAARAIRTAMIGRAGTTHLYRFVPHRAAP